MIYFDLQAYLGHSNTRVDSFGGTWCVICYIIIYSSNSKCYPTFADPPDCLLQTNYLQNVIIAHDCFFNWLEMPIFQIVLNDLNSKFTQAAVLKPCKTCLL